MVTQDATPRTLYVRRNVLNQSDILSWAKAQGFTQTVAGPDLHVTIAYSHTPVDWMQVSEMWGGDARGRLVIAPGGARLMEQFGEAVVLAFVSSELAYRHETIKEAGASWDHPQYQPHITITYKAGGVDLKKITPYKGRIVLGPEIFEEVNEDWTARETKRDSVGNIGMTNCIDTVRVSKVRQTNDGYLVAEAHAVREGIQLYGGSEVGKPEMPIVRVYRPRSEVFSVDSLRSFSHAPITMDHPMNPVNAENWKDLAVGEVSTAALPDGEWVMLPLILKDAAAIGAVRGGKVELSAGYSCQLDFTPGVTADGAAYDAVQRNIRINHLAIVDRARAGSRARIGDGAITWGVAPITQSDTQEDHMSEALKAVVVGDSVAHVAMSDAAIIEKFKADMAAQLSDMHKQLDGATLAQSRALADQKALSDAELAKAEAARDAALAKIMSDAEIDKRVTARATLMADAQKLAPTLTLTGMSDADIRRATVVALRGASVVDGKSADYVSAAFDILVGDAKTTDPVRKALSDGAPTAHLNSMNASDKAYFETNTEMENAWMHTKGAA